MQQHVIQIKLDRIEQLFNSLDPTPFVGRDLDPAADDFIEEWASEFARDGTIQTSSPFSQRAYESYGRSDVPCRVSSAE